MVSVIVPYIEDRGYLSKCLDSIYAQNYPEFEVIEVKSPASVAVNINIGLKKAEGEFLKVIGEDDWIPVNSLKVLVEGMKGHPWICANAINVEGMWKTREIPPMEGLKFENMVKLNVIHNGTTMYRTEVLREIGGMDETLWTAEEYEMHLRLMSKGYLPGYVDEFVYFYRMWGNQKSRRLRRENKPKRNAEIERIQALYSNAV